MSIEIIVGLLVVVGVLVWYFNRSTGLDVNADGKVDAADAKQAVANTAKGIKNAVDLDGNGKVGLGDVKVAADAVSSVATGAVAEAKRTVTRAKTETKRKKAVKGGDLSAMTKDGLLAHAKKVKAKANASMTKAAIIEAINAVGK